MIPLHLRTTTIHVAPTQADTLVESGVAEWLSGVRALVAKVQDEAITTLLVRPATAA